MNKCIKTALISFICILLCIPAFAERQWNLGIGIGFGVLFSSKDAAFLPASSKYIVTGLNLKFFVLENLALEVSGSLFESVWAVSAGMDYFPVEDADYLYVFLGGSFMRLSLMGSDTISFAINAGAGAEFYLGRQLWGWGKPFVEAGYFQQIAGYGVGCPFMNIGYDVYNHPEQ